MKFCIKNKKEMLSYLASHNGCVPTGHLHLYYMF
nr:MAG TPA: hypothetical protein [Caudoviricetes sp.]